MIPTSCYVNFSKVNLSFGKVCRQFIESFIRKQFLKPFGLDQREAFLLPSSELNDSQLLVFQDFFFFIYIFRRTISPFQLFRQQYLFRYRNFHHFLALWWARNNFGVIFSFVQTVSALFTFHVLVPYGSPRGYSKFYFSQAFKFAELKLQIQLKESQLFHIV